MRKQRMVLIDGNLDATEYSSITACLNHNKGLSFKTVAKSLGSGERIQKGFYRGCTFELTSPINKQRSPEKRIVGTGLSAKLPDHDETAV